MSKDKELSEVQTEPKRISLYSRLDMDTTVFYDGAHIVIPPRGVAKNLDISKLDLTTLGAGIIKKSEDE